MGKKKHPLKERTREYLAVSKEKILQAHKEWVSAINSYSDDSGQIKIAMDDSQILHSISISEKYLAASNKEEIQERLTGTINKAVIQAGSNAVKEMQKAVPTVEFEKIISDENKEAKEQFELLIRNNNQSIQAISSRKRTVASESGDVTVIIFGNRLIHSIIFGKDFLTGKKKKDVEQEIMETVNKAMGKVMDEIQGIMKKNEEEFNKHIIQA